MHPHPKVLLVSMPVSSARYPSLALGLLKQAIAGREVGCDVRYFSLDYVKKSGADTFTCLADLEYYSALVGEWVFAKAAHGEDSEAICDDDLRYIQTVFRLKCPRREFVARFLLLLAARTASSAFIEWCVDQVDWTGYAVLGVSTSFQQNMASLAFARRVKARFPHVLIVFGGANCQGEMGLELHRNYRFIDAICLGEGDRTFPELVCRHLAGESGAGLPGIVVRAEDGLSILPAHETDQIEDLDDLSYPDLSDFYDQRQALPVAAHGSPAVVFETARGCWWGAKHHCTFCGLNGRMMAYRSKSQTRAYDEIVHLVSRYGHDLVNTDAILDMRYFEELLPRLAKEGPEVRVFWQMKANLRPEHFPLLSRAGVKRIQPGIEALDTALLALMKKGCSMLQNVQVLKLAAESGLSVAWNLLYGFPGEDPDSYTRTACIIPKLRHLQPPTSTGRVFADRFSPYFQQPASFGVQLDPAAAYNFIYPFEDDSVRRLAYHFHMRSDALHRAHEIAAPMKIEQMRWSEHHAESSLSCEDYGDRIIVTDQRWGWPKAIRSLCGADGDVLRLCWQITSHNRIVACLTPRYDESELDAAVGRLIEFGLLLQEDCEFLSLPLRQPGWRRAPAWDEIIEARMMPYALMDTPSHAASDYRKAASGRGRPHAGPGAVV